MRIEDDLVAEVGRLDHQRIAVPSSPRVAQPEADVVIDVRAVVERDDPDLVDHLLQNRHVAGRLQDQEVVVVAARAFRRASCHAALGQIAVRPGVGAACPSGSNLAVGRQGRNPAVWWVDHERGLGEPGTTFPPELVVGAGVSGAWWPVVAPHGLGIERGHLFGREHGPVRHVGRTFERCRGRVGPEPLEVRLAVGCPWGLTGGPNWIQAVIGGRGRKEREHEDAATTHGDSFRDAPTMTGPGSALNSRNEARLNRPAAPCRPRPTGTGASTRPRADDGLVLDPVQMCA
ncbi:MAG TPA: hypothetical protein EYQ83_09120 [Acidobacteria bacterium]|nr:hypothetical protein [Acidobacteriota bacterium]